MHILVDVAADRLCAEIVELLQRAGHSVERGAPSRGKRFDLVLVGSPELAEKLRRERPLEAIIVVTKIGDVPARVRALEAGADDAFDASFAPSQMVARVGAAGRRAALTPRASEVIETEATSLQRDPQPPCSTITASTRPTSSARPISERDVVDGGNAWQTSA